MLLRFRCLILVFVACLSVARGQTKLTEHTLSVAKGTPATAADLSSFSWLQGEWAGEGLGAKCDEIWSAPAGNCMVGTFRMVKEGKLVFSEFFMLQKQKGRVVLKLKHFGGDFIGWEEKDKSVDFPLIKVEGKTAWFGGLTYQLQDDGSLKAWVAMKQKDGSYDEGAFHFRKRP